MQAEWVHEGLPPTGRAAHVWLGGDSLRRVERSRQTGQMRFIDCTAPHQQAWCDPDRVQAWRLAGNEISPPVPPAMAEVNEGMSLLTAIFGRGY